MTDVDITPRLLDLQPRDWALLDRVRALVSVAHAGLSYPDRLSALRLVRAGLLRFVHDGGYAPHQDLPSYLRGRRAALQGAQSTSNPYDVRRYPYERLAWNDGHAMRALRTKSR